MLKNKPMTEDKEMFNVHGFTVKANSTYVIKDKRDMDAPTGYIKAGITKLPSKGVSESFQVNFVSRDNGRTGIWDTGFFEYSPCYRDLDNSSTKPIVAALKKNLLTPYRQAVGNATAFEQENEEFFKKSNFKVYTGKTYNTSDPIEAMELYFGLMTYQVTPKGQEGNTIYDDSSYIVVDINKDANIKDERALGKFTAIGAFSAMLKADKERLISILNYSGMTFAKGIDDTTLIGMFNDYLEGSNEDRTINFNALVEETESKDGLEKLFLYKTLKEQYVKGGKVSKVSGLYFYDDVEIGSDLKNAALNVTKQSKLIHIKKELLLLDEDED